MGLPLSPLFVAWRQARRPSPSWIGAVDAFFAKLTKRRLKRGVFYLLPAH
jgi:hypothetical protein